MFNPLIPYVVYSILLSCQMFISLFQRSILLYSIFVILPLISLFQRSTFY